MISYCTSAWATFAVLSWLLSPLAVLIIALRSSRLRALIARFLPLVISAGALGMIALIAGMLVLRGPVAWICYGCGCPLISLVIWRRGQQPPGDDDGGSGGPPPSPSWDDFDAARARWARLPVAH
jgi:hypothetical protein